MSEAAREAGLLPPSLSLHLAVKMVHCLPAFLSFCCKKPSIALISEGIRYRRVRFSGFTFAMSFMKNVIIIFFSLLVPSVICGTKSKPHGHTGVLEAYTGKSIPFKINSDQNKKLDGGQPVSITSYFLLEVI